MPESNKPNKFPSSSATENMETWFAGFSRVFNHSTLTLLKFNYWFSLAKINMASCILYMLTNSSQAHVSNCTENLPSRGLVPI